VKGRRKKQRRGTRRQLHPSPIAVTLDGVVFANISLCDGVDDAESAIHAAAQHGGRMFVGVELREGEVERVKEWIDDASYECLAFMLGARPRSQRRRKTARGDE